MSAAKPHTAKAPNTSESRGAFGIALALMLAILAILFFRSFNPNLIQFSNDGPYGTVASADAAYPQVITGCWQDLNSVGTPLPAPGPSISTAFRICVSPLLFSRFYCPFVLLVLGVCSWFAFRLLGLPPAAACLVSLATMLNSSYFSTGCWGIGSVVVTIGATFVAIGLVASPRFRRQWTTYIFAGFAIGMGVMEGYDVGALYSVCLAALIFYLTIMERILPDSSLATKTSDGEKSAALSGSNQKPAIASTAFKTIARVAIVGICAGIVAAHSVSSLVSTQIKGVAGVGEEKQSEAERWSFATQWSMPKREALAILIPGVFGFRQRPAPNDGSDYWGLIGSSLIWDSYFAGGKQGPPPQAMLRLSGGGPYAGVLVILIAAWAAVQSLRKRDSVFTLNERKFLWFWIAAFVFALLLSFGRFAPFYRIVYALPYSSSVRNPAKLLHIVTLSILMCFAVGIHGLYRRYLTVSSTKGNNWSERLRSWWREPGFDRNWILGCVALIFLSIIGWLIYATSRSTLVAYLQIVGFHDEATANSIASFSIRQVGWFILVLAVSTGALMLVLSGALAVKRTPWGLMLLGAVIVADLTLADRPWIFYWDWKDKYASNLVIDRLRQEPYQHREATLPIQLMTAFQLRPELQQVEGLFYELHYEQWLQHQYPLFNIQSLDIVQMSRKPADLDSFDRAMSPVSGETLWLLGRHWQLTNTRYILGSVFWEKNVLNQAIDPLHRFHVVGEFAIGLKPDRTRFTGTEDLTAVPSTNGNYAMYEFEGALPRAKLYANWQVDTNNEAVLKQLTAPSFDPEKLVLLSDPPAGNPLTTLTNQNTGSVEFASYAPKHIVLKAKAETPSILLLNDKYDSNWQVRVDGKREPLLHANYLMRGVYLQPGDHTVAFDFKPSIVPLFVSLAAIAGNLVLAVYVVLSKRRSRQTMS
jgi:hypothetical protein